jgi:hypothetical protein
MNRAFRNVVYEPPIRLLVKAMLSNYVARRYAFEWAALFDAVPYPAYATGLRIACNYASLARAKAFSAIEFGVAGGNGLVELSTYAEKLSQITGLDINVVGFDAGSGLPDSADYRDAPWLWKSGDFPSNLDKLRREIPETTELVVGRIEETFPRWLRESSRSPIGFVAMDVDYFSSAQAVLNVLAAVDTRFLLPFISFYFDDTLRYLVPRPTGEFAAVAEFNASTVQRKFDRNDWVAEDRPFGERLWLKRMYSLCCFDHPRLCAQNRQDVARLELTRK